MEYSKDFSGAFNKIEEFTKKHCDKHKKLCYTVHTNHDGKVIVTCTVCDEEITINTD
jgi:siroheme synthase (precorrin-2 oxidase/ferrochelatase)